MTIVKNKLEGFKTTIIKRVRPMEQKRDPQINRYLNYQKGTAALQ